MPPKRKTTYTTPNESPAAKRRALRTSGPLVDTQPAEDDGSAYTGLNGGYWGTPSRRGARTLRRGDEGSLKENRRRSSASEPGSDGDSPDELLLSPSKSTSTATSRASSPDVAASARKTRELLTQAQASHRTSSPAGEEESPIKARALARTYGRGGRKSAVAAMVKDEDDEQGHTSPSKARAKSTIVVRRASTSPRKRGRSSVTIPEDNDEKTLPTIVVPMSSETEDASEAAEMKEPSPPPSPSKRAHKSTSKAVSKFATPRRTNKSAAAPDTSLAPAANEQSISQRSPRKKPVDGQPTEPLPPKTPTRKPLKDSSPPLDATSLVVPTAATSPTKASPTKATTTPSRRKATASAPPSPSKLPRVLPGELHPYLRTQKREILRVLCNPPNISEETEDEDAEPTTNELAYDQLSRLLQGTNERGEGNSCMIVGPRGSGKTAMVERILQENRKSAEEALRPEPIVIRLSGHVQHNDRLAMREITRQLVRQTGDGGAFLDPTGLEDEEETFDEDVVPIVEDEDENPFLEKEGTASSQQPEVTVRLPPTAHLPSLISMLPTLGRPIVLVLDAFDLFALHARQALLYCLLDTVQHSQAGAYGVHFTTSATPSGKGKEKEVLSWSGLAVIGVTTRVDTLELLEKRVKSRFSGRMIRTAGPASWEQWESIVRGMLCPAPSDSGENGEEEAWKEKWNSAIDAFLETRGVREALRETVALVKDVRLVVRILTALVLSLNSEHPWPTHTLLQQAIKGQRCPPRFATLHTLHYPAVCLLIAATHERIAGHESVTFEQLHDVFRNQVRKSQAAPVQIEGGSIGMVRCGRGVMMGAFEQLVAARIFVPAGGQSAGLGREFLKYRCVPEREDVKSAVDKMGKTNLKKWFTKAL